MYKENKKTMHDLIVVGAGVGGCMTAKTAADAGLNVLLIDSKPKDKIGDKVCANVVSAHDLNRVGIKHPRMVAQLKGVKFFSPDQKNVFTVKLKQFVLDRRAFGQKLFDDAIHAGCEFCETKAIGPVMDNWKVVGVRTTDKKLFSRIVIDASGFAAVIRNKLPNAERVRGDDIVTCYLEIRRLRKQIAPYFLAYLGVGNWYAWMIPMGGNRVNIGLGVKAVHGHLNPKEVLYSHFHLWPELIGSSLIEAKWGVVPTRSPITPLCSNGVMFVGDAACQANPISGGGIGSSLAAGKLAGGVAADVIKRGHDLMEYHERYLSAYGNQRTAYNMCRLLQHLTDDELNYIMSHRIITQSDLRDIILGITTKLTRWEKTKRSFRGMGRPRLLFKLWRRV